MDKIVAIFGPQGPITQVEPGKELQALATCRVMGIEVSYRVEFDSEGNAGRRTEYGPWGNA